MGVALTITRADHTPADLRFLACKSDDGAQIRRLLAPALVVEGRSRTIGGREPIGAHT